ncbi:MAG: YciI family protein [Pseudolabrys sp.]
MQFVVFNRMVRPDLTMTSKPHLKALVDHIAYMKGLREKGKVVIAGGFLDGAGGMDVIDVDTVEEALEICQNDPLHKGVYVTQEIHPYDSDLGPRLAKLSAVLEKMS